MSRRAAASGGALPLTPPPLAERKQPLILKELVKPSKCGAEVTGGTTAECAMVVYCCPCSLINLLILTVVRLPAGFYRCTVRRQRIANNKKNDVLLGSVDSYKAFGGGAGSSKVEQGIPLDLLKNGEQCLFQPPAGSAPSDFLTGSL